MDRVLHIKVQRFNPEQDKKVYFDHFEINYTEGMTVLDALMYIKENYDATLTFRASCRMGICGSCAVLVNGFPHLSCHTQIKELKTNKLVIKPLPNYAIIKDLVVNLEPLFEKHKKVKPGLIHINPPESNRQFLQSEEELNAYEQFSYCIKCGICVAACPTCATDEAFLGPQALAQSYRYSIDSRDEGFKERKPIVDNSHGIWHCHFAGACSNACPKGVDPALAIQKFKGHIICSYFKKPKKIKAKQADPIDYNVKPKDGAIPVPDKKSK